MTATVIIPTTGTPDLRKAIDSVLNQSYKTECCVVVDGEQYSGKSSVILSEYSARKNVYSCYLPVNVGANGFYGHRVYAAFTHLVNTKYVLYLDQDCWFEPTHVEECIKAIEKRNLDWSYSLRKIRDKEGNYLCNDDCESLGAWKTYHGAHHIDTNCYCIKTEVAIKLAQVWHGGWGQDRVWFQVLSKHFLKYDCTGFYTLNYRVDGNAGSVNADFFYNGNEVMNRRYDGDFPWRKRT
jgi:glycosyltransferase involved in cell wall biosynthesis